MTAMTFISPILHTSQERTITGLGCSIQHSLVFHLLIRAMLISETHACIYNWVPSVCLCKTVSSGPLPILKLDFVGFFAPQFYEFLICLDMDPIPENMVCRYCLHSVGRVFILLVVLCCAEALQCDVVPHVRLCFCRLWFWCHTQEVITGAMPRRLQLQVVLYPLHLQSI